MKIIKSPKAHPSGKPQHRNIIKGYSLRNRPDDGSIIPRLQRKQLPDAIGFGFRHEALEE